MHTTRVADVGLARTHPVEQATELGDDIVEVAVRYRSGGTGDLLGDVQRLVISSAGVANPRHESSTAFEVLLNLQPITKVKYSSESRDVMLCAPHYRS
jgi:hypothetical protein